MKKLKSLVNRIFEWSSIVDPEVLILNKNNNHGKTVEAFKTLSDNSKIHLLIMLANTLENKSLTEFNKRLNSVKEKA